MTQKKGLKQFHGATVELEVQEFDGSGRFEGWATVYNVPIERWNGSVIMKAGMFSESIKEKGATQIRMLWQHNPDWPIGVYESFSESDYGLRAVGRLMVGEVKKADEVYAFMKRKAIGGLSVGFGIEEEERNKDTGLIEYSKGDLWETSAVTFPANSQAKIDSVHARLIEEVQTERDLEKLLRDAGFSKRDATAVALHGFKGLRRRDADEVSKEVLEALSTITQEIRKAIPWMSN
jgi:phage prohead protease, HK97 family